MFSGCLKGPGDGRTFPRGFPCSAVSDMPVVVTFCEIADECKPPAASAVFWCSYIRKLYFTFYLQFSDLSGNVSPENWRHSAWSSCIWLYYWGSTEEPPTSLHYCWLDQCKPPIKKDKQLFILYVLGEESTSKSIFFSPMILFGLVSVPLGIIHRLKPR